MFSVFVEKRVFASRSDGGDHDHMLFDESMLAKVQLIKKKVSTFVLVQLIKKKVSTFVLK